MTANVCKQCGRKYFNSQPICRICKGLSKAAISTPAQITDPRMNPKGEWWVWYCDKEKSQDKRIGTFAKEQDARAFAYEKNQELLKELKTDIFPPGYPLYYAGNISLLNLKSHEQYERMKANKNKRRVENKRLQRARMKLFALNGGAKDAKSIGD